MKISYTILILALIWGCSTVVSDADETIMRVNSHTVDCIGGVMEGKCLLVQEGDLLGTEDWENFYFEDSIIGFDYEPGYIYTIRVRKTTIPDPPQDSSSIRYELVQILSKEKQ